MRSATLGGEVPEGCIPLCLVVIVIVAGIGLANMGAVNNDSLQMSVGLILALGALALALGGYMKFKF